MMRREKRCWRIAYILSILLFLNLFFIALFSISKENPAKPAKKLIAIDPGHGGKDIGCKGSKGLTEKEITLKLSLILRGILLKKPNLNVFLTRSEDVEISSQERVSLANSKGADLFLSLHVNASFDKNQKGIEIYYYSEEILELPHSSTQAQVPNRGTQYGETSSLIFLWNEAQNSFIAKSREIATFLENILRNSEGLDFRAVKPAPLVVLTGTTMPGIVIEIGFITNPEEESALSKEEYLKNLASKLAEGVSEYLEE